MRRTTPETISQAVTAPGDFTPKLARDETLGRTCGKSTNIFFYALLITIKEHLRKAHKLKKAAKHYRHIILSLFHLFFRNSKVIC